MIHVGRERFGASEHEFNGWRVRITPARSIATPAVVGGSVLFGGGFGSHEFYAIDAATGELQWSLDTSDDGPTAAVVLDGVALFNTESCTLMAVNASTGAVLWDKWLGDPLLAQPAAADGRVLMVYPRSGEHWLGAFDIRTGERCWEAPVVHDVISAPIISNGNVYVATYDGSVSCFEAANGEMRWSMPMHATSAPWISGDRVHVAQRDAPSSANPLRPDVPRRKPAPTSHSSPRERTIAVDSRDGASVGAPAWKSAAYLGSDWGSRRKAVFAGQDAAVGFSHAPAAAKMHVVRNLVGEGHVSRAWRFQGSRPVVMDGVVFETTGDRLEARALDTDQVIWSWTDASSEEGERRLTPPAVSNGRVLIGTWDGRLVSLHASDGHVRWEVPVGAPVHWQPVMAGGRVFAGLEDGSLVAFETADVGDDGWPMWGGGPGHNGPEPSASFGNTDLQPTQNPPGVMRVRARLCDGHVVLHLGSRQVLLDTGSPYTLGRDTTPLPLAGALVPVNVLPLFDLDRLSSLVGTRIDVVLGNDVLLEHSFMLRLHPHEELLLAPRGRHHEAPHDGVPSAIVTIPFERRATLPVCSVRIGVSHESVKAIIDTGAVVSLAPDWWLRQHAGEPSGERHEFYLSERGWVEFDTPLWRVPIEIGAHRQHATFARVPPELAAAMRQRAGTDFLFGTDLFRHSAESVVFDAGAHEVRLHLIDPSDR